MINWIKDKLALRSKPVNLVIALHDTAPGLDQNSVVIAGSTARVNVFVVDHRAEARERFFVVRKCPINNPNEFVEVVSDEAAEYLQLFPELTEQIVKTLNP
jgi:hypothetical protein